MDDDPLIYQDHNGHNPNPESISIEIIVSSQDAYRSLSYTSYRILYDDSVDQYTLLACSSYTRDPQFLSPNCDKV